MAADAANRATLHLPVAALLAAIAAEAVAEIAAAETPAAVTKVAVEIKVVAEANPTAMVAAKKIN